MHITKLNFHFLFFQKLFDDHKVSRQDVECDDLYRQLDGNVILNGVTLYFIISIYWRENHLLYLYYVSVLYQIYGIEANSDDIFLLFNF